jgi:hypothetical protein
MGNTSVKRLSRKGPNFPGESILSKQTMNAILFYSMGARRRREMEKRDIVHPRDWQLATNQK